MVTEKAEDKERLASALESAELEAESKSKRFF